MTTITAAAKLVLPASMSDTPRSAINANAAVATAFEKSNQATP